MKRFLVADDSAFMRSLMKKILTECGYIVVGEAENGKIALEKYKELMPDFVTMDITMNIMCGLESLKEIKKYDVNANVIMVSAMGQGSIINEALSSGAKGFLVKPFNKESVASIVATIR